MSLKDVIFHLSRSGLTQRLFTLACTIDRVLHSNTLINHKPDHLGNTSGIAFEVFLANGA